MRRIAHISDIHFGSADAAVVRVLVQTLRDLRPDLLVLSGDLTQRARSAQFIEARAFLDEVGLPQIVVPGNHDVPLYNVYDRFLHPLDKYKKYITNDLMPFFEDDEMAVLGINTSRSMTIKGGRINAEQMNAISRIMTPVPDIKLKVIVSHHPFDVTEEQDDDDIVGNAQAAMEQIIATGADVFLSGHIHVSGIIDSARRYVLENGRSALIIQAGTAASTRVRGELNSFNLLEHRHPELEVTRYDHDGRTGEFRPVRSKVFAAGPRGWLTK